jgi:hypothetical protein
MTHDVINTPEIIPYNLQVISIGIGIPIYQSKIDIAVTNVT